MAIVGFVSGALNPNSDLCQSSSILVLHVLSNRVLACSASVTCLTNADTNSYLLGMELFV